MKPGAVAYPQGMLLELAGSRKVLFIGGKGGVGKTATSSALAVHQAQAGQRVLVVSTDPAHNLGHLWEQTVGDEIVELFSPTEPDNDDDGAGAVFGVEIDPARTISSHIREVGQTLRDFMPEHLHKQVDRHLALAGQSPGTHESAFLERIAVLLEEELQHYDLIVFDTAPSGHTARLMALPEIMSAWTEGLLNRRTKAEKFGAAIRAFDNDDDPASTDSTHRDRRIRQILTKRKIRFEGLRELLSDHQRCSFVIVLNAERLPVLESAELHSELLQTGVDVGGLVVNRLSPEDAGEFFAARRVQEREHLQTLRELLPGSAIDTLPLLRGDVIGPDALLRLASHMR